MRSCKSRPFRSGGFTLLELTISIVLVAMIVIILAASMRAGYRSLEGGERKAESMERLRVSMRLIDSQLQSCLPLTVKEEESLKKSVFIGTSDSMTFATNRSLFSGRKGYVIASYRIERDERGKQVLYLKENTIGMENSRESRLLDGFDAIRFEYLETSKIKGLGGGWSDQMADTSDLPQKVKLHLEQGARKLSLTIPLRTRKPSREDSEEGGTT
ncbi:MAG: prepilin-type N-terminal cleavage/methylation domain-containing protein [Syntrophorhabdaceae bacterium]|nr:prepilin-type N-terminal cleavage/methylation domain-containing protein [Syntrophorhabdaceae bacterium]